MTQEYIKTSHTPSIAHNGNFSRGMAYWFGCYIRHARTANDNTTVLSTTPKYSAEITRYADTQYPSGINSGLHQFIDHPNIPQYPSKRRVGGVAFVPVSTNQIFVYLTATSTIDGRVVTPADITYAGPGDVVPGSSYTPPSNFLQYYQHPFIYRDDVVRVRIAAGSEVSYSDHTISERTGVYRAGRVIDNYPGAVWAVSNHILEVLDPNSRITPVVSNTNVITSTTITDVSDPIATVVITGSVDLLIDAGVARGDIFSIGDAAGAISSITVDTGSITLSIKALENKGKRYFDFVDVPQNITSWSIFRPSIGTATVQKNVFKYDLTLAYSYNNALDYDVLADVQLTERVWGISSIDEVFTSEGPGYEGYSIPRVDTDGKTLALTANDWPFGSAPTNNAWFRRIERFTREVPQPIEGRLMLSLVPHRYAYDRLGSGLITDFSLSGNDLVVTCAGTRPSHLDVGAYVRFEADDPTMLPTAWKNTTLYKAITPVTNQFAITAVNDSVSTYTLTFDLTGYTVLNTTYTPEDDELHYVFGVLDYGKALISDVRLLIGDYTQFFGFNDSASIRDPRNAVRDILHGGIDTIDNILPSGMVTLYTGGDTCPAGFKPVDGFANSASPGLSFYEIPIPDTYSYDADTDRSVLSWTTTSFPIYDELGNVKLIEELSDVLRVVVPALGSDIVSGVEPPQQAVQPGVFLKIPAIPAAFGTAVAIPAEHDTMDYTGVYYGKSKSLLITHLQYNSEDVLPSTDNVPSGIPWSATTSSSSQAIGKGVISYPYLIDIAAATLVTSALDQTYPPLGPVGVDQDQIFQYGSTTGVVNALIEEGNPGSTSGSKITYMTSNLPVHQQFKNNLRVGDVYHFSWTETGTGTRTGSFIGRVIKVKGTENRLWVVRYDGQPLDYEGVPTAGSYDIPVVIRPAKLFGYGKHSLVNGVVKPNGVSIQRTTIVDANGAQNDYWTVAANNISISLTLKGEYNPPPSTSTLWLEPSGFLKNGTPTDDVDYGSGGHTHLVSAADTSITVTNLVPRVNELALSSSTVGNLPWYPVPREHHHGHLPVYRWILPKFHLFTLCEKL